jgi:hypothetical protein
MRAETAFPALALAAALFGRSRRVLVTWGAIAAATLATCACILRVLASGAGMREPASVAQFARDFLASYLIPAVVGRSVVWAAFGIGVATLFLAAYAVVRLLRGHGRMNAHTRAAVIAVAWATPFLAFWLPNPTTEVRHFFLALPPIAWPAGTALSLCRVRTQRALAAAAVIANLVAPEVTYGAFARLHGTAKEPVGSFFAEHHRANERLRTFTSLAHALVCKGAPSEQRRRLVRARWCRWTGRAMGTFSTNWPKSRRR